MTTMLGFSGSGARSGKTTAALEAAQCLGGEIIPLAGALKAMLNTLFTYIGIERTRRNAYLYGDAKGEVIPELGVTSRHLMQTLGTEWGRECVGEDFWHTVWSCKAAEHLFEGTPVVVDDIRFQDEAEYLRGQGAKIVRVVGVSTEMAAAAHASEQQTIDADVTVVNDGTIKDLHDKVRDLI